MSAVCQDLGTFRELVERHPRLGALMDGSAGSTGGSNRSTGGSVGSIARLGGMDGQFDSMDGRLGGLETTLAEVVRRLPEPS